MKTRNLILIAEDTEEDVELLKIAIRKAEVVQRIEVVRDGEQAIAYLCGTGQYADREKDPFPGVLFLDIKMPKLGGLEVLQWLKEHEECRVIPVMVLTSSAQEQDVTKAYQLGTNSYMVKPNNLNDLVELVKLAFRFWSACTLPSVPKNC